MSDQKWKEQDLIRLAAFIDGEGCIALAESKNKYSSGINIQLSISITNCDPRLIIWCLQTFGGTYSTRRRKGSFAKQNANISRSRARDWRRTFDWRVNGRLACDIAEAVKPYILSKAIQIDVAIAFRETIFPKNTHCVALNVETQIKRKVYKNLLSYLKIIDYSSMDDYRRLTT